MDKEQLGVSFIKGREEWTKLFSKFIKNHADKCDLNLLFNLKVLPSTSESLTSVLNSDDIKEKENDLSIKCISDLNLVGKVQDSDNVRLYKNLIGEECKEDDNYKNSCIIKASYIPPVLTKIRGKISTNKLIISEIIQGTLIPNQKVLCSLFEEKNYNNILIIKIPEINDDGSFNLPVTCILNNNFADMNIPEQEFNLIYLMTDNRLEIESQIYKHAIPEVMKYTPFILNSYGTYECELNQHNQLNELMKGAKKDKGYTDIKNIQNGTHMNLLLLEKSSGTTLGEVMSTDNNHPKYNFRNKLKLIFQLFWTLTVTSRLNIRHNDLHFDNIFVDELKEDITLYFKVYNKYVKLTTKYLLRVYDFDFGSVLGNPNIDRNMGLDNVFCSNYGRCNQLYRVYDLYTASYICYDYFNKYNSKHLIELFEKMIINIKFLPSVENKDITNKIKSIEDKLSNIIISLVDVLLQFNYPNKPIVIEIVDVINEYVLLYVLPENKEIKNYQPECKYETKQINISEKTPNIPQEQIKKYIDSVFNTRNIKIEMEEKRYIIYKNEYTALQYDIISKTKELVEKYMSTRIPQPEVSNGIILVACKVLCCPVYHKIMNNKSMYKEDIISSFYKQLSLNNTKYYIDDVWKTFNNKLPIEIPLL